MDVTDPEWRTKLVHKDFVKKNKLAVTTAIKNVFKQINLVSAIGKKHEKELYEQLCDEVDPTMEYTAYDIAMMVMSIPGHVSGLPKVYDTPLAKACGKAPYVEYGEITESSVVLTA